MSYLRTNSTHSKSPIVETYGDYYLNTWDCPTLDGLEDTCRMTDYTCNQCPPGWVGDPKTGCTFQEVSGDDVPGKLYNRGVCPPSAQWSSDTLPNAKRDWARHCNVLWPGCGTWSSPEQCQNTQCPPGWEYKKGADNDCQVTSWNYPKGNCWAEHKYDRKPNTKNFVAQMCDVSWPVCGTYKNCAVPEHCTDYDSKVCQCKEYAPNTVTVPTKMQMGCVADSYAICLANVHGHSPEDTPKYLAGCVKTANKLCNTNVSGEPLAKMCEKRASFLFPNENAEELCRPVRYSGPQGTTWSAEVRSQASDVVSDKAWEEVADTVSQVMDYTNEVLAERLGRGDGGADSGLEAEVSEEADAVIDSIGSGIENIPDFF